MSLNNTPSSERIHIGIFGKRNAGKSSIINAITGQDLAIVSDIKGTTTDPVLKSMELLPLGPIVIIDTPGLDDDGELGALRIKKAYQMLNKTDIALLIVDQSKGLTMEDRTILNRIQAKGIPYLIVKNKADLELCGTASYEGIPDARIISVSAAAKTGIEDLKNTLGLLLPDAVQEKHLAADLVSPLDFVVLVIPIDASAPKGRLILPQQQVIRDLLDFGACPVLTKETSLKETLASLLKRPALVITDSQVFHKAASDTPKDIPLTSFSILLARYKGYLIPAVQGARYLSSIQDGDRILISEGCTHHRQCEDIGTVKLPKLIRGYTKAQPEFVFSSGTEFPDDLSSYKLIIHCGGCMLNDREMKYRITCAQDAGVPITNYGIAIAQMNGILERSVEMLEV